MKLAKVKVKGIDLNQIGTFQSSFAAERQHCIFGI